MNKKQEKQYKKQLAKSIYEQEFNKQKSQLLKQQRQKNIDAIRKKAKMDAEISMQPGGRVKQGFVRMQRGAMRIEQKRRQIGEKVAPYVDYYNKQFAMSGMQKQQDKRKQPPRLWY